MSNKIKGDPWTPFIEMEKPVLTVEHIMQSEECSQEIAEKILERENKARCFRNNLYQVLVYDMPKKNDAAVDLVWLSIKRNDKRHIHDWRDLQRIKNELVGSECEAVELYPPESRLVDEANQYHLWVFKDPSFTLGLGYQERRVSDWDSARRQGERQRPLPCWMKG